jgi:cyclase
MKRIVLLGTLLAAAAASMAAQAPAAKVIDIVKLKDNLYVLTSSTPGNAATFSGGNVAVFITDGGVTLVDDKLAGWGQAVLDKVKSVTDKPIMRIINTHTHGDHTGNNGFFGANVEIVAQENTKTNMEKMDAFKGDGAKFLPAKTYKDKMTIGSGKDRIDLYYFGSGHTGGDGWVVFPALRVMHAGGMIEAKQPPIIDVQNGGSGLAYPSSLAKAAASIKNVDTIITGHGPVMGMKDLEEYAEFTRDFRDAVVSGYNHGLGLSEVAAGWKIPDRYRDYTAPPERVKANVQAILAELTR